MTDQLKRFPKLEDFDVDPMTVSRWRSRLKSPAKYAEALEAAKERCVKVCEARQGRTTAYRTNAGLDSQPDAHSGYRSRRLTGVIWGISVERP